MPRKSLLAIALAVSAACAACAEPPAVTERRAASVATLSNVAAPTPIGPPRDGETLRFHCAPGPDCPELFIQGDALERPCADARLASVFPVCPVRGHYDPSIVADPTSGELWLAYTRGSLVALGALRPENIRGRHDIALARSADGGVTWRFDGVVQQGGGFRHSREGERMMSHEVATLSPTPDGGWALIWLQYFDEYQETALMTRRARRADALADAAPRALASGWARPRDWPPAIDAPALMPDPGACAALTEPSVFRDGDHLYLAVECVGWDITRNARIHDLNVVELFRWDGQDGLAYVGRLLDAEDARAIAGPDRRGAGLTQPSLARSRDGRVLLLATPADYESEERHFGCVAFEVEDLARARMVRGPDGALRSRARITAPYQGHLGPGLCAYDPASETGVLITLMRTDASLDPLDIRLALHATGVHP